MVGGALPRTQTKDVGEYRFEHFALWGRYTVYAEDPGAGFSWFAVRPGADRHPPIVEITAENQQRELTVYLPPKPAFFTFTSQIEGWPCDHLGGGKDGQCN